MGARGRASVEQGPQHQQREAYWDDHAEDRCRDENDPFGHKSAQMTLAAHVASRRRTGIVGVRQNVVI